MIDCRDCDKLDNTFGKFCSKKHKIQFSNDCSDCGIPYNYDIYWENLMKEENDNCPDWGQRYYDDPSGS